MECINFDRQFERYLNDWLKKNASKYKGNEEAMEDEMPNVYMEFLNKPADWLNGIKPMDYFTGFQDPTELVDLLLTYIKKKVPVPDLLLERITQMGEAAQDALLAIVCTKDAMHEAEMMAISLLREMECSKPMQIYIDYIAGLTEPDEKGDLCADALLSMGKEVVEPILQALNSSKNGGLDIFADILSNYPGDERIYEMILQRFENVPDQRALFASYLAKLGDERALTALERAAQAQDVSYLDFVEIVNAIEALGGDRPADRDFSGDPYYESLKLV